LLLDDELPGLSYLKLMCGQIPEIEVVKAFNDPTIFLQEFPELEFDLCILDIEMPGISGIEIARLLKGKPIIFTTAYKDYAVDAFELDAVDYLIKPIGLDRFQQAVNKVIQRNHSESRPAGYLRLNTDKGIALLDVDLLSYIRTSGIDSRDKTAFLTNGAIIQLKNISFPKLISLLPAANFCQINKQELISLANVKYFTNSQITIHPDTKSERTLVLNLGDSFRSGFLRRIKG
jgi:DNA-binding LytR/AlgR family response regulator